MTGIILALLAVSFNAGILDGAVRRTDASIGKESFEEKLKRGYNLLKNERNADNTMKLLEQLHSMEGKMKGAFTLSPKQNADLLNKMKDYMKIKKDRLEPMGDSIEEVNKNSKVDTALYQGDIILTKEQTDDIIEEMKQKGGNRVRRQAFRDKTYPKTLWSEGVFYSFGPNSTEASRRVFKKAAEAWQSDSCIDFVERSTAKDRIVLIRNAACWSSIGRIGGVQTLSLGEGSQTVGTAAHEIGHALGFHHTHSRHDRDDFITIYTEKLLDGWLDQYGKETERTNYNYNLTYDYGSVMNYGAKSASNDGEYVMVPHDVKYIQTLGSPMISFYDKLMLNMHYKCLHKCIPRTSAVCQNGGFPHPRDCSKCICPGGYGGRLCNERPPGCGKTLIATSSFKMFEDKVSGKAPGKVSHEFTMCNYWIEAPAGSKIEVVLERYSKGFAYDGCEYGGVEIKTGQDKRQTGYRFCAPENAGTSLVSVHNIVPIITYSNVIEATAVLSYRIVSPGWASHPSKTRSNNTTA